MPNSTKYSSNKLSKKLQTQAYEIRKSIIELLNTAGAGHTAGPLGMTDIFTVLYFHILNIDPKKPLMNDRDKVVLSNGHICPVLYATMAHRGYFAKKELNTFRKINTRLQGHPHNLEIKGIENSSGPLGQGLSQAIGMALAAKLDGIENRTYCLGSDGEINEGQIWEAAMWAGNKRLNNLTWIIDRNNIQIDGFTEDVMPLEPLRDKLEAFNWHVIEIDGHNIDEIISACLMAQSIQERPTVIIAHTIPGKGVDFMENKYEWHGTPPNDEQTKQALKQLNSALSQLKGK